MFRLQPIGLLVALTVVASLLTPEKATSNDVVASFNYHFNAKMPSASRLQAAFSGYLNGIPMDIPLVHSDALFVGDHQQLLYGLYRNGFNASALYCGFENGAFMSYDSKGVSEVYMYLPPTATDQSCEVCVSCTTGYNTACRQEYRYDAGGVANNKSQALYASQYFVQQQLWYNYSKSLNGSQGYAPLLKLNPSPGAVIPFYVAGLSFSYPIYSVDTLIAVPAIDFSSDFFAVYLNKYKTDTKFIYFVESDSFHLVGSSNGASSIFPKNSSGELVKVFKSRNSIVQATSSYLSNDGTVWRPDGDYSMQINSVYYAMNLFSYFDQSYTLKWKLIVVDQRDSKSQTADYKQTLTECMTYTVDELSRIWDIILSIAPLQNFLHGSDSFSPLTRYPMFDSPLSTGSNQQVLWALDRMLNTNTGTLIDFIGTGYESGAFLSYTSLNGVHYHYYRANDSDDTSCLAIEGYPSVPKSCARMSTVNFEGIPVDTVYQHQFDPRTSPWYSKARSFGQVTWTNMALFEGRLQIYTAAPLYTPGTQDVYGVATTAINLQYLSDMLTTKASSAYTAYIVQKRTGYLMGTSIGLSIYNFTTQSFIKAVNSTNEVIKQSYEYLTSQNLVTSCEVSVNYLSPTGIVLGNMSVLLTNLVDASKTLEVDVVYVELYLA